MSVAREDPYLKRLRREAKEIKRAGGVSQSKALDMIASKLGHANWPSFVRKYESEKSK